MTVPLCARKGQFAYSRKCDDDEDDDKEDDEKDDDWTFKIIKLEHENSFGVSKPHLFQALSLTVCSRC